MGPEGESITGSGGDSELRDYDFNCKHHTRGKVDLETACCQGTAPSSKATISLKQYHQLGTKCKNTWVYGIFLIQTATVTYKYII